jgi:hypothetical protein
LEVEDECLPVGVSRVTDQFEQPCQTIKEEITSEIAAMIAAVMAILRLSPLFTLGIWENSRHTSVRLHTKQASTPITDASKGKNGRGFRM